jgi:aminoglycoside phosphotransferase (APT) family kinase protein
MVQLLGAFDIGPADLIGAGQEAWVYALGADRVLRIFRSTVPIERLRDRLRFYEVIRSQRAPFRTPSILDAGERHGRAYWIEHRLPGRSLAGMLPSLAGRERARAFASYVAAAAAVRALPCPQSEIGEVLAEPPMHRASWPTFLVDRAGVELQRHRERLGGRVTDPDRALDALRQWAEGAGIAAAALVHGDFFPENVLVGEDGTVSAVIDFGPLSLVGDPRLDVACSVFFLAGLAGVTPSDRDLAGSAARSFGVDDDLLRLYGLYYAFRFLGAARQGDGLLRWCTSRIAAASAP